MNNTVLGRLITFRWRKYNEFGKGSVVYPINLVGKYMDLVGIGNNTHILPFSRIQCFPDKNSAPYIKIGSNCVLGFFTTILCAGDAKVEIGDYVLMASHILIAAENHGMDAGSDLYYIQQPLEGKSVSIGDGCWIGEKVIILSGVKIGRKTIIGAGSVVANDIPPYSIAVGNPARVIKHWNTEKNCWKKVE